MNQLTIEQKIYHVLRVAVAMCYIGHGAFGIIIKPIWYNYFAVFGIGHNLAYHLMPLLGSLDVLIGIVMLVYPIAAIPAWLVVWGIVTAMLRPLAGEPFGEFVERAGNFGAPLALLLLLGINKRNIKNWFTHIKSGEVVNTNNIPAVKTCLRVVVFLLFAGHGWLNIIGKPGLLSQYAMLGLPNPVTVGQVIGALEIIGGLAVLIKPSRPLIMGLFIWKISSELFYPHYELFEWIERGGSYGSILALWFAMKLSPGVQQNNFKPAFNSLFA